MPALARKTPASSSKRRPLLTSLDTNGATFRPALGDYQATRNEQRPDGCASPRKRCSGEEGSRCACVDLWWWIQEGVRGFESDDSVRLLARGG
jgi:hypothetical protein